MDKFLSEVKSSRPILVGHSCISPFESCSKPGSSKMDWFVAPRYTTAQPTKIKRVSNICEILSTSLGHANSIF